MVNRHPSPGAGSQEAGFTLVEAMIAILVLMFGLMAIASLFAVAGTSNSVANQGTAAAAAASQTMERLRAMSYNELQTGGTWSQTTCSAGGTSGPFWRCDDVQGVGRILSQWQIATVSANTLIIRVRSEGLGPVARGRSRAEFTMFRSCTDVSRGCPTP
jgi:Tfp pilus assembly protein PilV